MNIYVGNLALTVTEADLRHEFVSFGTVSAVTIMNDTHFGSGQPRGYGYVDMPSTSEGESAILAVNGKCLKGRIINAVHAMPLSSEETKGRRNARIRERN
jgi:RNA recognition motif-containing protein